MIGVCECSGIMRRIHPSLSPLVLLSLFTALSGAALGQQNPLVEPVELCPGDNDILGVNMDVKLAMFQGKQVRAYHLQSGGSWKTCSGEPLNITTPVAMTPGPTFRLRRKDDRHQGTKFQMTLSNSLEPTTFHDGHACNPARQFDESVAPRGGQCTAELFPALSQTSPSCFHGNNVTNFHYHGFHVSPQPPEDWVLLSLFPKGSTGVPTNADGPYPQPAIANAVGSYRYDLMRLPPTQAEGTHWYHPHKHGSTGLQVLNGMAGTFVIEGPFDDWLNGEYDNKLDDKVLVVQQIDSDDNFFRKLHSFKLVEKSNPKNACTETDPAKIDANCLCQTSNDYTVPKATINGTLNPTIEMAPGEVQRWRLIGATMQASAQLQIGFDPSFGIRQIAEDGVQFARENYINQPLLQRAWFIEGQPNRILTNYVLAPGNRADFLVKAPMVSQRTCYAQIHAVTGQLHESVRALIDADHAQLIEQAAKTTALAAPNPPLLSVCVDPTKPVHPMEFPSADKWPALPPFLKDLEEPATTTTVAYSMKGSPGQSTNGFYIDNVQYCAECANHTLKLGETFQWRVTNDSRPNHPFHIHINPFQLVEKGYIINGSPVAFETFDPPIWQDTQALPSIGDGNRVCTNVNAGPIWNNDDAAGKCEAACPGGSTWNGNWVTTIPNKESVCGCCPPKGSKGYFLMRQEPIEFTGEFVNHCHILGHEDRGMMQNVQTVCANGKFGTPQPNAQVAGDDCTRNISQARMCPVSYPSGAGCAGS